MGNIPNDCCQGERDKDHDGKGKGNRYVPQSLNHSMRSKLSWGDEIPGNTQEIFFEFTN